MLFRAAAPNFIRRGNKLRKSFSEKATRTSMAFPGRFQCQFVIFITQFSLHNNWTKSTISLGVILLISGGLADRRKERALEKRTLKERTPREAFEFIVKVQLLVFERAVDRPSDPSWVLAHLCHSMESSHWKQPQFIHRAIWITFMCMKHNMHYILCTSYN